MARVDTARRLSASSHHVADEGALVEQPAIMVPAIQPFECHLWWAKRSDAHPMLKAILNDDERQRLLAFRRRSDQDRFLTACGVLRLAMSEYLLVPLSSVAISRQCHRCGEGHGKPNYLALADFVRHWQSTSAEPVVLVTFNYDPLLEAAWTNEAGMGISSMESYITQPLSAIIKVHGSVDWGHRVATNELLVGSAVAIDQAIIENIDRLPVLDDFHLLHGAALIQTNTDYSIPAIAVPVRRKTVFECPEDHLAFLRGALPKVRRLLVLGWAGGDTHFLQMCEAQGTRPERTLIVCGSEEGARQTNLELNRFGLSQNVVLSGGGFSDLMSTNRHELNQLLD